MEEKWDAVLQRHKTIRNLLALSIGGLTAYYFCKLLSVLMLSGYGTYLVYIAMALLVSLVTRRWIYGIAMAILSAFVQHWLDPASFYLDQMMTQEFVFDGTAFTLFAVLEYGFLHKFFRQSELTIPTPKNMRRLQERNGVLREENEVLRARGAEAETEAQQEKLRSDLLRAISHDLRTPLTTIAGASDILARQGEEMGGEERKRLCENIQEEALWLNRMVENLLSVTKINSGAVQLQKNVELVEEIFQEVLTKFCRRAPEQTVKVEVPRDEILMAPMDAMLIEQVLLNLLENAVHHARAAEPLELSAWRDGNEIFFRVRDHGRGIAEEDTERLFRGDLSKADSTRGMGIGLSVCSAIIAAHDGKIYAENAVGGGAAFYFTLPVE